MKPKLVWMIVGLVIALPILGLAVRSLLSQRPSDLGVSAGRLAPCPETPNCVSSQAGDAEHRIEPLPLGGDPQAALDRLARIVESLSRTQIVTREEGYLHAEFTSAVFRFVDDVEFLVDAEAGVVHVRSASRVGYSDLGVNRKRVETIRRRFAGESAPGQ